MFHDSKKSHLPAASWLPRGKLQIITYVPLGAYTALQQMYRKPRHQTWSPRRTKEIQARQWDGGVGGMTDVITQTTTARPRGRQLQTTHVQRNVILVVCAKTGGVDLAAASTGPAARCCPPRATGSGSYLYTAWRLTALTATVRHGQRFVLIHRLKTDRIYRCCPPRAAVRTYTPLEDWPHLPLLSARELCWVGADWDANWRGQNKAFSPAELYCVGYSYGDWDANSRGQNTAFSPAELCIV